MKDLKNLATEDRYSWKDCITDLLGLIAVAIIFVCAAIMLFCMGG